MGLFNSSWQVAEELTEKTLVSLYNEITPSQEKLEALSAPTSRSPIIPTIDKLFKRDQEFLPIDTILQASQEISATLLPAPLTALVRKSLEDRYKAALEIHVEALTRATMSAERLQEKTRILSEFAENFLRRLSKILRINSVPAELAIAIRHPSVRRSTRTQLLRRPLIGRKSPRLAQKLKISIMIGILKHWEGRCGHSALP